MNLIKKDKSFLGVSVLLITSFIWGLAFVFQKKGIDHIGPITFMASRCFLAVLFLGILLVCLRGKKAFKFNRAELLGGLSCGIVMTIANGFQQVGIQYTTAGKAGFVTAMYILIVPIINSLIFKKKVQDRVWLCAIIGVIGMYLLCAEEGFHFEEGDLIIFGCAVFFSFHIICADRFGKDADPVKMSFLQFSVSFVINLVIALMFETSPFEAILEAKVAVLYCGILSAGVGYTLQMLGQKYVEPATASLIMSLESVFAVIGGSVFLMERMTIKELIGCIVMFGAIVLVQIKPKKKFLKLKK